MATLSHVFPRRRAVLVSGGISSFQNHSRYLNDLVAFYNCLISPRYNFSRGDIQVVYANGGIYDIGGAQVTTQPATQPNVERAIERAIDGDIAAGLAPLGTDDLFVLLTTNHGDSSNFPHRLLLWTPREFLESPDLGKAVKRSKSSDCYCLAVFGHCFGVDMFHEFLTNTPPTKTVAVAASQTASYALGPDYAYDAFLYHFTAALNQATPSGYPAPPDSDAKRDGQIDVREAFDFARKMDNTKDKPAIGGDSALADRMTLEGLL